MSTQNRMGAPDWARFLKYVRKQEDGCWIWMGAKRGNGRNEYGAFWAEGGTRRAHIVSYVWSYGEPNADLHHICDQPLCVNPEHVTPAAAGQARHRNPIPGLCKRGHSFDGVNSRGDRTCSICQNGFARTYREANRDTINAKKRDSRVRVEHEPRKCAGPCGLDFIPKERSTNIYCERLECVHARKLAYQREYHRARRARERGR